MKDVRKDITKISRGPRHAWNVHEALISHNPSRPCASAAQSIFGPFKRLQSVLHRVFAHQDTFDLTLATVHHVIPGLTKRILEITLDV